MLHYEGTKFVSMFFVILYGHAEIYFLNFLAHRRRFLDFQIILEKEIFS